MAASLKMVLKSLKVFNVFTFYPISIKFAATCVICQDLLDVFFTNFALSFTIKIITIVLDMYSFVLNLLVLIVIFHVYVIVFCS